MLTCLLWLGGNLLYDPASDQEILIFCSQTLRSEVQWDFEELYFKAFHPLQDSQKYAFVRLEDKAGQLETNAKTIMEHTVQLEDKTATEAAMPYWKLMPIQ
ncbi:unnamed protein product [Fraxinus pennsylvanica]|uniref:Uncharacterized protein n=1 Tax=Fraxinus pennsylvanica TaxID=56036 RepID=A0AAD1Z4W0_9LAMI|nr:unnamed protein product [Fraxinus pennsylvanica]